MKQVAKMKNINKLDIDLKNCNILQDIEYICMTMKQAAKMKNIKNRLNKSNSVLKVSTKKIKKLDNDLKNCNILQDIDYICMVVKKTIKTNMEESNILKTDKNNSKRRRRNGVILKVLTNNINNINEFEVDLKKNCNIIQDIDDICINKNNNIKSFKCIKVY